MTIQAALTSARRRLAAAGIEEHNIEAELLLRHALGLDRAWLLRRLQEPLDDGASAAFDAFIERRLAHEPSAYITGHREFYGLDLIVTAATLIPRPETEMLVDAVLELSRDLQAPVIADVGTGSGAIATALARELPAVVIYATDTSSGAIEVAAANARRYGVEAQVRFRVGDLLEPVEESLDIIVANLPYVTTKDWRALPPELREHEPRSALDGGSDGLHLIRRLLVQAPSRLKRSGAVCLEFGVGQRDALRDAAAAAFPGAELECREDLGGLPRVLIIRTR